MKRCDCRPVYTSLPGEFDMGYRRVMKPGCDGCKPEPESLAMLVDRYLRPLHRRHVLVIRGHRSKEAFACATPEDRKVSLDWSNNGQRDDHGMSISMVDHPAVKIGDRWLRRVPWLVSL